MRISDLIGIKVLTSLLSNCTNPLIPKQHFLLNLTLKLIKNYLIKKRWKSI